jgi:cytochrome c-type biogenesis protein CcmI
MGLFKLLTFPVSGPVAGGRWVLQTLLDEAERRYYDPAAIRQQMADLEAQHRAGNIGDEEFDRREEELLERLLEAREVMQRRQAGR